MTWLHVEILFTFLLCLLQLLSSLCIDRHILATTNRISRLPCNEVTVHCACTAQCIQRMPHLRMNIHGSTMPVRGQPGSVRAIEGNLEEDEWNLLKQRITYDLQAFRVTGQRMASWESAKYHEELMQRRQRFEVSNAAAKSFLSCYVNIILADKVVAPVLRNMGDFVDRSMQRFGLQKAAMAACLVLVFASKSSFANS